MNGWMDEDEDDWMKRWSNDDDEIDEGHHNKIDEDGDDEDYNGDDDDYDEVEIHDVSNVACQEILRLCKHVSQLESEVIEHRRKIEDLEKEVEDKRCVADLLDKLSGGKFFETVTAAAKERKQIEQLAAKVQEELQGNPRPDPSRLQQLVSKDNQGTFEEKFMWPHVDEDVGTLVRSCRAAHYAQKQVQVEKDRFHSQVRDLLNDVHMLCLPGEAKTLNDLLKEHMAKLQTKSVKVAETVDSDPRWKFNDTILREKQYDVQQMSSAEKQQAWTDEHSNRIRDRQNSATQAGECLLKGVKGLQGCLLQEACSKLEKLHGVDASAHKSFVIRSEEAAQKREEAHGVISKLGKSNSVARSLYDDCGMELSSVQSKLQGVENKIQEALSQTLVAIKEANQMTNQICFYRCRRIELWCAKEDACKREKACEEELSHTLHAWEDVEVEARACHNQVQETIEKHHNEINQQMIEYTEAADFTCKVILAILGRVADELNQEEAYLKSSIKSVTLEIKKIDAHKFKAPSVHKFERGEKKHCLENLKTELTVLHKRKEPIRQLQKEIQDTNQKVLDLGGDMCQATQENMTPNINESAALYELFDLWQVCEVEEVHSATDVSENAIKEAMDRMADKFATELNKLSIELHMVKAQNQELSAQLTKHHDYEPSLRSITAYSYDGGDEEAEVASMKGGIPVHEYDGSTGDSEATGVQRGKSASSCSNTT